MKYQICPVCKTKVEVDDIHKKIIVCPASNCPNPFRFSEGMILDEGNNPTPEKVVEPKDNKIVLLSDTVAEKRYEFPLPAVINRSSFSNRDLAISEHCHALIDVEENAITITDTSSFNATWLNEERCTAGTPVKLNPGISLRIGNSYFNVEFEVAHEK